MTQPRIDVLKLLFQGDNSDLLNHEIAPEFDLMLLAPARVKKLDESARALLTAEYSIIQSAHASFKSSELTLDERDRIGSSIASLKALISGVLVELQSIDPRKRQKLLEPLRHMIVDAYIIGARGTRNPTLERLEEERKKAQTRPAREKKNVARPAERLPIVSKHAIALWEKNSTRNGAPYATATDIFAAVNEDLEKMRMGTVSESTIRRDLPKVPGWKPKTGTAAI
jgi:hypothetical protein